ncbi:MAG TPA: RNA polymerase sigma factor [Bryobacteraceae bacterium]|nr:RNA polymerase sigma factor [Bryobacteraceae bacterium]
MFRETAFNDIQCDSALDDTSAGLVMDEETFRAFYERTARGLWAYLARLTGDRQLAEDLLQETFYRFLRAASTYRDENHRRNSLYRIATNLARDAHRRSLARASFVPSGGDIERAPSGQDAAATERVTDFARAMARLKPRERAMLWLAYAEGASHQEIADVLGLRPASLKPLLFRARRKLADLLGRAPQGGNA